MTSALLVVLFVITGLLALLVVGLLRSHADILRALHELGVGEAQLAAPATTRRAGARPARDSSAAGARSTSHEVHDITGVTPDGGAARVSLNASRGTTLLAFLSSGCGTCQGFWDAFDTDAVDDLPGSDSRVVVVTRGPEEESPATIAQLAPSRATTVLSSEAWDAYGIPASPYFILIEGSEGIVGEGSAPTWGQVVELMGKAAADAGMLLTDTKLSRRDMVMGRDRELRADRELARAGIAPDDESLFRPALGDPAGGDEEPA